VSAPDAPGVLVEGAAAIATLAGGIRKGASQAYAAVLEGGPANPVAVAAWGSDILAVGPRDQVLADIAAAGHDSRAFRRIDASGRLVTPGLVDAHTHLVFAGTREAEWQMRLHGASYLEVLAAGGGILSTVEATRAARNEELEAAARRRLGEMLACGTTTAEAKSGYGLSADSELRLLEVIGHLGAEGPVELVPTFLGAHAVAAEFRGRPDATDSYVASVIEDQLPRVAEQGIARFCDAFCEAGVFGPDQTADIFAAARSLGLALRVHADELAPSGGAELAARMGCLSADHLAAPSDDGVAALAEAAATDHPVVATLLPATGWFMGRHHFAPARRFIDAGVPVALASDLNPGTSPTVSLPLVMSIACLEMGLLASESLAAVTVNAAHSLGMGDRIGSLEAGKQADLVIWDVPSVEQLPYWLGTRPVLTVLKRGAVVFDRTRA
jgi:imidazolonepropionase